MFLGASITENRISSNFLGELNKHLQRIVILVLFHILHLHFPIMELDYLNKPNYRVPHKHNNLYSRPKLGTCNVILCFFKRPLIKWSPLLDLLGLEGIFPKFLFILLQLPVLLSHITLSHFLPVGLQVNQNITSVRNLPLAALSPGGFFFFFFYSTINTIAGRWRES